MNCVGTQALLGERLSRSAGVSQERCQKRKSREFFGRGPSPVRSGAGLGVFLWLLQGASAWAQGSNVPMRPVQNIFDPRSGPADTLFQIATLVLVICAAIFLIVGGLTVYAAWRFRRRGPEDDHSEPPQVYGSSAIELAWTVPPILIVLVLALVTARTIGELRAPRTNPNDLKVVVVGHRYWWEFRYPKEGVVTANEMHVPINDRRTGEATQLILHSADTNHGFWVPDLAGKSWLVPNYENTLYIQPWDPGVYLGNCTVLCGDQHANMLIRVIVESKEDFQKWIADQKQAPPQGSTADQGRKDFVANSCGSCHRVGGTVADGVFGPDLTHFAGRQTLGSGVAPNDDEHLRSWLKDPQVLKPGCLMPNMGLRDNQVEQILAYLKTLK
jgi:cytochrome c oxidase subunit II